MIDKFNKLNENFKKQITEIQEAKDIRLITTYWCQIKDTQKQIEKLLIAKPQFQIILLNMKYCIENRLLQDFHSYLLKLHKAFIQAQSNLKNREIWNIGNAVGHVCEMHFTRKNIHFTLSDWNLARLQLLAYNIRTKYNARIIKSRQFQIKEPINYKYRKLKAREIYEIKGIILKIHYKAFKKEVQKLEDWDLAPKNMKFLNEIPFIKHLFVFKTIT